MIVDWRELPAEWRSLTDKDSGVYFFIEGDQVAYIGKSLALKTRIRGHRQYRSELQDGKWSVRYHRCSVSESDIIEKECIRHYQPFRNVTHKSDPPILVEKIKPPAFFPEPAVNETEETKGREMNLAWLMKSWRHFNGLSMREASDKLGLPTETYRRLEEGSMMRGETLAAVLRWILS